MKCKICESKASLLFNSLVLNKYQVGYYKCLNCDFIQTEKPFWLNESYDNAITDLDVGLVSRNMTYSEVFEKIIKNNFNSSGKFLDYAGGYGLFVRLMRDKGFDYYREDKYCENIFAKHYDLEDMNGENKFEAITALEVFEHLENPIEEIKKMFKYSDTIMFSTDLQPNQEIRSVEDWWYFIPETGQHIAFYSEKTLRYIAEKLNCSFYSSGNLHLISKKEFKNNPLLNNQTEGNERKKELESLVQPDFEFAKNIIAKTKELRKRNDNHLEINKNEKLISDLSLVLVHLDQAKQQLGLTKTQLASVDTELDLTKTELGMAKEKLSVIYSSNEWKVLLILRQIFDTIFPSDSLRRKTVIFLWRAGVSSLGKFRHMASGILLAKDIVTGFMKHRKPRKINVNSKKLVYIGHSYHNKTKSTAFLIDYLKQFFDVEVILDESWRAEGQQYPDLSFIDENYLGVIFFQNLPSREILKNVKNNNIIFFPMYDGVRHDYAFWKECRDLKIMNFSSTLHKNLERWGLDSMHVQYFPKPQEFAPGKKDEIFFWQRLTRININFICQLLGDSVMKMHVHKAIDPGHQFTAPSKNQEDKYNISYSEWFDTREEMQEIIKQKGMYVAPREFEGIGMSFLEAMAMGKAVIAVDNPTMNEYIKHGETGYLFDLSNPKEIDLSGIELVQKNTHEFMRQGFAKWEKDKHGIIDFIKKP